MVMLVMKINALRHFAFHDLARVEDSATGICVYEFFMRRRTMHWNDERSRTIGGWVIHDTKHRPRLPAWRKINR
jgi:hypothetical protein